MQGVLPSNEMVLKKRKLIGEVRNIYYCVIIIIIIIIRLKSLYFNSIFLFWYTKCFLVYDYRLNICTQFSKQTQSAINSAFNPGGFCFFSELKLKVGGQACLKIVCEILCFPK